MASFDTTAEELENLAAEMGVKGLPQFRFYNVRHLPCRCSLTDMARLNTWTVPHHMQTDHHCVWQI